MKPTLRQLEYLVALSESLSFRKAAAKCFVSQPSLSAQIQELEKSLGVRLFERDRRRVMVTSAGEKLVESARRILADVDDMIDGAATRRDPLCGILRLGILPTIAPYVLPNALPLLHRRFPDLRLLLCEEQTHNLVELVRRGRLDLLVIALEAELADLETMKLLSDSFVVVLSESHALARKPRIREVDLEDEDVILLSEGHCLREQVDQVCSASGAQRHAEVHAMSLNTIVHMVAARIGISLLPAMAIPTELRDRKGIAVKRFVEPAPSRSIGLAWRKSSPHGAAFGQIGALLKEVGEAVLALGAERDSTASGGGRTASRNGRSKPR